MAQAELPHDLMVPAKAERGLRPFLRWVVSWEDWITLGILLLVYLGTARTMETAGWVRHMPSLMLVSFLALLLGVSLARWRASSWWVLPLALAVGMPVVLWQVLGVVPGDGLADRWGVFVDRLDRWFQIVRGGGISRDPLPFTIIITGLTWMGTYLAVWSVYRWQNPWLALAPAGVAIFANLAYQPQEFHFSVGLYVFGALLLLMRVNLLQQMRRWDSQGVPRPEFLSLSFINHTVLLALILLVGSWFVPANIGFRPLSQVWDAVSAPFAGFTTDASRLFSALRVRQVLPVHSFGSILPLRSDVRLRDTVIMKVMAPRSGFLRGAVYDEYIFGGWKRSQRRTLPLNPDLAAAIVQDLAADPQHLRHDLLEIEVKPLVGRPVLFSLGQPVEVTPAAEAEVPAASVYSIAPGAPLTDLAQRDPPASVLALAQELQRLYSATAGLARDEEVLRRVPEGLRVLNIRRQGGRVREVVVSVGVLPDVVAVRGGATEEYRVVGAVSVASAEELRSAPVDYPPWVRELYLQLPADLPQRVRQLAAEITQGADNPYDAARAVEEYLRQFPVDTEMPEVPLTQDPVDFFLFDARRGYFDFHASAMVVLLRAVGVPARLAVGYVLDPQERDEEQGFTVRERHAYAWPEVFFPGLGWVEFNPTPDRPALERAGQGLTTGGETAGGGGPEFMEGLFPEEFLLDGVNLEGLEAASTPQGGRPQPWPWLAGAVAVIGAVALAVRWAWQRGLAGLPYPAQVWEKTLRLANWAKIGPQPQQTPREYARHLGEELPELEGIDYLAEAYNRAQFGKKEVTAEEEEEVRSVWVRLRNRLWARILRWR